MDGLVIAVSAAVSWVAILAIWAQVALSRTKKNKNKNRYTCYHWLDEPWRSCWWRVTPAYSIGYTCQCEKGIKWHRENCPIHGPSGEELYEHATEYGTW